MCQFTGHNVQAPARATRSFGPTVPDFEARIRCYGELNDFLSPDRRYRTFSHAISGNPTIEEVISALGIPPTGIDLVLVNGRSMDFRHRLQTQDLVSIYPVFESLDISAVSRLPDRPLRHSRFLADVHLGKLARLLRMLGFDTVWQRAFTDSEILAVASKEQRILLTRDRALLRSPGILRGFRIASQQPREQLIQVLRRLDLVSQFQPFTRCMRCNGLLVTADKAQVLSRLPPRTRECHSVFCVCVDCDSIYWEGSHHRDMVSLIRQLAKAADPPST